MYAILFRLFYATYLNYGRDPALAIYCWFKKGLYTRHYTDAFGFEGLATYAQYTVWVA